MRRLAAARRPLGIVGTGTTLGAPRRLGLRTPAGGVRPLVEVLDLAGATEGGRRLGRQSGRAGRGTTTAATGAGLGVGWRPAGAGRTLLVAHRRAVGPPTAFRSRLGLALDVDRPLVPLHLHVI